jgi:hypothetical protein
MRIALDGNARGGKSTKTQRLKIVTQQKPLIYLDLITVSLAKKEWW